MPFNETIQRISTELNTTFDQLDAFFDLPQAIRSFRPAPGEWCIDETLENIMLANHFLMITLKHGLDRVLKYAQTKPIPKRNIELDRIAQMSDSDLFDSGPQPREARKVRSEHVRIRLTAQRDEGLHILSQIQKGEGLLYRFDIDIDELGELDMYQWLYLIVQHA